MSDQSAHNTRYEKTMRLIREYIGNNEKILDLGSENVFTHRMRAEGYAVENTGTTDLDLHPEIVKGIGADAVTALEILEHLVSPFPLLQNLPGRKLIATIPMRLWFKSAYRNKSNEWDWHFHEFEDWQFDWLLEKSGWRVIHREKWTSPSGKIGIRPFLRSITPRYYAVYAERI